MQITEEMVEAALSIFQRSVNISPEKWMRAALEAALAALPAPAVQVKALPDMRCDACDNRVVPDWTYCPYCGAQSRTIPTAPTGEEVSDA